MPLSDMISIEMNIFNDPYIYTMDSIQIKRKEKRKNIFSPDELGTNCLLRFLPLIVRLQLKDVPVDELLPVRPQGEFQGQRLLARNLCCQPACN